VCKIDARQAMDFFVIYVYELLTDLPTFNIVLMSGHSGILLQVTKTARQRGFGYGECE
jgi:hypothetical protein